MINIPEYLDNLQPYKAGKPIEELAREKKLERIVKLASNENPLGASPKAMQAINKALANLHYYPDSTCFRLREAIAKKYQKNPQNIFCSNGSDSILEAVILAASHEGEGILSAFSTFIGMYVNVIKLGRVWQQVDLQDYSFDLQGIAEAINEKTRIVYLANPNNPTGAYFSQTEFETFMQQVPKDVLVILDEAYTVYAKHLDDYPDGFEMDYENLLVTRTFSKAHGLAGLRIGYAFGPEQLIATMFKTKLPFEPNYLAQEAAIAALQDEEFLQKTCELNLWSLQQIKTTLDHFNISYVPTAANFVMAVMPDENFAARFNEECLNRGLIIRHVKSFAIPNGIRISSGSDSDTRFAIEVITEVLQLMRGEN